MKEGARPADQREDLRMAGSRANRSKTQRPGDVLDQEGGEGEEGSEDHAQL